jgi:hypothetical protein
VALPRHIQVFKALLLAAVFAFALPLAARAATTYTLQSGTLMLTVDEYSPTDGRLYRAAAPVKIAIDGATVILDPDTAAIQLLDIQATPFVELSLYPGTPSYENDAYRTLIIDAFSVYAADGALLGNGAGFSFAGGASVDATLAGAGGYGSYASAAATPLMPGQVGTGSIYGGGDSVTLSGVAIGLYDSPFNDSRFVITGNFNFIAGASAAPVPEPGSVLLFLTGLGVASFAARDRRGRRRGVGFAR